MIAASAATRRRTVAPPVAEATYDLRAMLQAAAGVLLERPSDDLDPALDAAIECFTRHGVKHTSIPDIARELGVSRATLYRQVGSISDFLRLAAIREFHRFLDTLPAGPVEAKGASGMITVAAAMVRFATEHPVIQKVITDEPEFFAEAIPHFPVLLRVSVEAVTPLVAAEMSAGRIPDGDAAVVAELVGRVIISAILAPPAGNIEKHLRKLLAPVVEQ